MSIQSEINRIRSNISSSLDILSDYGVSVDATANSNDLPYLISALAQMDIDCGLFGEYETVAAMDLGAFDE